MIRFLFALFCSLFVVGCEPVIVEEEGDTTETPVSVSSPTPEENGDGQCDGCEPDVVVSGNGDDDDASVGESPAPATDTPTDTDDSPTPVDPTIITPTQVPDDGFVDSDGDGVGDSADCDAGDPAVYPGADETCNSVDDDCDNAVDEEACSTPPPAPIPETNVDGDGYSVEDGDCDDGDAASYPGAEEECGDGVDQDCDEQDETCPSSPTPIPDEPTPTPIPVDPNTIDNDGDSLTELEGDCDDLDPLVYTGAPERCNGLDDDCDGQITDEDCDGDEFAASLDCDDADAGVYPTALETCNGVDEDCDEEVDEDPVGSPIWYADVDLDGYGISASSTAVCVQPAGYVSNDDDCDDSVFSVHPGASEDCDDGIDQDCNGQDLDCPTTPIPEPEPTPTPDPDSIDNDGDGFSEDGGDCDDEDSTVKPGADEICDSADNDCDNTVDEGCTEDSPTPEEETPTSAPTPVDPDTVDNDGDNLSEEQGDCDDLDALVYPGAPERCNGTDDDCDGSVTDEDCDGDNFAKSIDCDDADADVYPGADESCDGVDEDCDGSIDESATATWYRDADGDGYGSTTSVQACSQPSGYVGSSTDCDDSTASIHPGATELCDSADNDCDSAVDEGEVCTVDPLEGFTDSVCDEDDILLDTDGVLYIGSLCMPAGIWRSSEARIVSDISAGTLDWDPTDADDAAVLVSGYKAYEFDFVGLSTGEYQFQIVSSIAIDGTSAVSSSESSWKWLQNSSICSGASDGSQADQLCRVTETHDDDGDGHVDWYSYMFVVFVNADGSVDPFGDGI